MHPAVRTALDTLQGARLNMAGLSRRTAPLAGSPAWCATCALRCPQVPPSAPSAASAAPPTVGLQLSHGLVLDVGGHTLGDLELHLLVLLQGRQEGAARQRHGQRGETVGRRWGGARCPSVHVGPLVHPVPVPCTLAYQQPTLRPQLPLPCPCSPPAHARTPRPAAPRLTAWAASRSGRCTSSRAPCTRQTPWGTAPPTARRGT